MDNNSRKDITQIVKKNISRLITERNASMRNVSTVIEASEGYVQKVACGKTCPSLGKLDSIGEYFDVDTWMLLYDAPVDSQEFYALVERLSKLPPKSFPVIEEFIDFLIKHDLDK